MAGGLSFGPLFGAVALAPLVYTAFRYGAGQDTAAGEEKLRALKPKTGSARLLVPLVESSFRTFQLGSHKLYLIEPNRVSACLLGGEVYTGSRNVYSLPPTPFRMLTSTMFARIGANALHQPASQLPRSRRRTADMPNEPSPISEHLTLPNQFLLAHRRYAKRTQSHFRTRRVTSRSWTPPTARRRCAGHPSLARLLSRLCDLGTSGEEPMLKNKRIFLSISHVCGTEQNYVQKAFDSNWLSTVGPNFTALEKEFGAIMGVPAVALSSGTAAIHLGLRLLGVGPGDDVFCPSLTFAASCNPARYLGAEPVFLDSDRETWNLDPEILKRALDRYAAAGKLPKALIVVHLFGQCADMDPILELCNRYEVPVLEDAAEALGSSYKGRPAGGFGQAATFSFNGNKIITTTGGGMLVSPNPAWVEKARFWSQQARDPGTAYEHSELGYNYRMSNVLAGIGRGQLEVLDLRVEQRRAIAFCYRDAFADLPGISLMPQAPYGLHTNWLSCFLVDEERFGCSRDELIRSLDAANIESRPVWKPMHLQPLYGGCQCYGGEVAEDLFRRGICLPSSSSLSLEDQLYVVNQVRAAARWGTSNGMERRLAWDTDPPVQPAVAEIAAV